MLKPGWTTKNSPLRLLKVPTEDFSAGAPGSQSASSQASAKLLQALNTTEENSDGSFRSHAQLIHPSQTPLYYPSTNQRPCVVLNVHHFSLFGCCFNASLISNQIHLLHLERCETKAASLKIPAAAPARCNRTVLKKKALGPLFKTQCKRRRRCVYALLSAHNGSRLCQLTFAWRG